MTSLCSAPLCPLQPHPLHPPHPPPLDWYRVRQATSIAAIATAASQLVSTPLDTLLRTPAKLLSNPSSVFANFPLHLMKRIPTKALTVALFELGTQTVRSIREKRNQSTKLSTLEHVFIAVSSGIAGLLSTYPMHLSYHALRKGATFSTIVQTAKVQPKIVYAGAVPALISTMPIVLVDYLMYQTLSERIGKGGTGSTAALIGAVAMSNFAGGVLSEPFKALSRRVAVESVKTGCCGNFVQMGRGMMKRGVGEFWRGFPVRSVRYAVSAVVSKIVQRRLQQNSSTSKEGTVVVACGKSL